MKAKLIDRTQAQSQEAKHQVFVSSMLVLLSGLGLGLSHIPLPLWWLAWISLTPLLLLWDRETSLRTHALLQFAAEVYTAFLIAFAIAFFWPLLHTFSKLHLLGKTTILAFGSLMLVPAAFTIPFVASLPFRQRRGRLVGFGVFAAFFLTIELLFEFAEFPWPVLGHSQGGLLPLVQLADLSGVSVITLWVLAVNGLIFAYLTAKRRKMRIRTVAVSLLLFIGTFGFGYWRQSEVGKTSEYVTVGLVQPAMDSGTWTERFGAPRVSRMIALSDSLISAMNAPPIFMIWPEMAIPAPISESRQRYVNERLQTWADHQQVALLAGALVPESNQVRSSRFFNRAMLYRPNAEKIHYDQVHHLPYDPQVPIAEQSPWLPPPPHSQFLSGMGPTTLQFDGIRIGMLLGFEQLLGNYARQYPRQQADFLTALTIDGWWGKTPGYRQHLNYLRLRSIETRRSIVQVATSGSTAVLSPDGSVIFEAESNKSTAQLVTVPLFRGITPYARFGNWLGYVALVFTLGIVIWASVTHAWRYWQALDQSNDHVESLPG